MRLSGEDYINYYESYDWARDSMDKIGLDLNKMRSHAFAHEFEYLINEGNHYIERGIDNDEVFLVIASVVKNKRITDKELYNLLDNKNKDLSFIRAMVDGICNELKENIKATKQKDSKDANQIYYGSNKILEIDESKEDIVENYFFKGEIIKGRCAKVFHFINRYGFTLKGACSELTDFLKKNTCKKTNRVFTISFDFAPFGDDEEHGEPHRVFLQVIDGIFSTKARIYEPDGREFITDTLERVITALLKCYLVNDIYNVWRVESFELAK